jgi:FMN phosphatase YigB (HAD superfamily)
MEKIEDIVLVDMDGTLCDHDGAMKRDYERLRSPNEPPYASFFDDNAPEYIRNRIRMIRNQPGWWENLEELKFGFDILDLARKLGFKIHILTKGPHSSPNAWTEKVKWARKHVGDADITITEDKGLVYGKILVDDYPKYIERWLEWRPRGLVIMPIQDHNRDFNYPNVIPYDGSNLKEVEEAMKRAKTRPARQKVDF